jgi:hypothetical protein
MQRNFAGFAQAQTLDLPSAEAHALEAAARLLAAAPGSAAQARELHPPRP